MKTIERDELKAKIDRGDDFKLLMTLGAYAFQAAHIPGSIHFAIPEEGFDTLATSDEIVVYCSNEACIASQFAYKMFTERGFTNVRRYSGGIEEWAAAGYPLEGEAVPV